MALLFDYHENCGDIISKRDENKIEIIITPLITNSDEVI